MTSNLTKAISRGGTAGRFLSRNRQNCTTPSKLPDGVEPGLSETSHFQTEAPTFPTGVISVREIDPDTGFLEIIKYTVVDDVGVVVNPLTLKAKFMAAWSGLGAGDDGRPRMMNKTDNC